MVDFMLFHNLAHQWLTLMTLIMQWLRIKRRYERYARNPHTLIKLLAGYRCVWMNFFWIIFFLYLQPDVNNYKANVNLTRSTDNRHDVWNELRQNWSHFYWLSGETPDTMSLIVQGLRDNYFQFHQHRNNALNFHNQVLLVLIWLRRYPTMSHLALHFGVSVATVHDVIHKLLPYFHRFLVHRYIKWHSMQRWRQFTGFFPDWPNCVAILDGTCFRISKPTGWVFPQSYASH